MALQLTLTDKLIKRTDSNKFKPNEALSVELTPSTGWTNVDSITAIVGSANVFTEIAVVNDEFEISASLIHTFGFTLQFIGKDSEGNIVAQTLPCKYAVSIGTGGSGATLPDLPPDASTRNVVLEAREGNVDWYDLTVLD